MNRRSSGKRHAADVQTAPSADQGERLQKVLAAAGVGSRRECEELIREGRVEVDRQVTTELGTRVHPGQQEIRVDGESVHRPKRIYYAVNKPPGVVCTSRDPSGRLRVVDLVESKERLFTVGRLDRSSEGLIIVTNDGRLADQLTHPRYGVQKTYAVRVAGNPAPAQLDALRKGVRLAEGVAHVASLRVKRRQKQTTDLEIVLNEGRNREIRRILARIGHKVLSLRRIAVGTLRLGKLPVGASRKLTREEIRSLEKCIGQPRARSPRTGKPRRSSKGKRRR